jgi:hypothetical protein
MTSINGLKKAQLLRRSRSLENQLLNIFINGPIFSTNIQEYVGAQDETSFKMVKILRVGGKLKL